MASSNNNMRVWDGLAVTDPAYVKSITGKQYKGDSPNPTYIIMRLTELLGPIGQNWGFDVNYDRVRMGAPHQIVKRRVQITLPGKDGVEVTTHNEIDYDIIREEYHEICITFWQIVEVEREEGVISFERRSFDAFGGTPMLYLTRKGAWQHDEDAAKKSMTDAFTKAASWLGAASDIFLGKWDDSKYQQTMGAKVGSSENAFDAPETADRTSPQTTKPETEGSRTSTDPFA